ncbi:hypothetical protein AR457_37660 [Streptomyces agglomeratus]|nr:hypothetical protein AR457_37660 [Streptomyces agglomeratus]
MSPLQILSLLLALSTAGNVGLSAGLIANWAGVGVPHAILTGAGAGATCLGIYFAAIAAYT